MRKQIILTIIALLTISVSAMASEFYPQKKATRTTKSRQGKVNSKNPTSAAEQNALGIKYVYMGNDEKAIYWLTKAAEQGYTPAQSNLGLCYKKLYSDGTGGKQAAYWLTKAAEKGDMVAQYELGDCYEYAFCINNKDMNQALYWYRKAADQGYVLAFVKVAVFYEFGHGGVAKDSKQAKYWYDKYNNSKMNTVDSKHIDLDKTGYEDL